MTSTASSSITTVLNAAISSVGELMCITIGNPSLVSAPVVQTDFGVLVGITGDLKGRLLLFGERGVFNQAGLSMYGMELPDDMLESFVGEFGNSAAGRTATILSEQGIDIDITPPTTMQGSVKLGGFKTAVQVPFETSDGAQGTLTLAMEG